MPLSVTNRAQGLLSILGSKNLGDGPGQFADVLAGTVNVGELLLLGARENVIFSGVTPVIGSNLFPATEEVPQNEIWYVWHYWLGITLAAGSTLFMSPSIQYVNINAPVGDPHTDMGGAAGDRLQPWARSPFWATQGSRFGFIVHRISGSPGTVNAAAVITRLRV